MSHLHRYRRCRIMTNQGNKGFNVAKSVDLSGHRFNRLTVLRADRRGNQLVWVCQCVCGGTVTLRTARITGSRPTRSCGCLQRETVSAIRTTHGRSRTYLYRTWSMIIQRCRVTTNPAYPDYGGRGITVCDRWASSFADFAADVGHRPSAAHTIDRIDNDRGYEPGNVRWATRAEQARNRRSNRWITANGETRTLAEWIARSGLAATTIERRLKRGWPPADAVLTPRKSR